MRFTKGYEETRSKMKKYPKFFMSCFNCDYYYKGVRDQDELCQNNNVLSYDMVVREGTIFCSHWKGIEKKKEKPEVFQKPKKLKGRLFKAQTNKDFDR